MMIHAPISPMGLPRLRHEQAPMCLARDVPNRYPTGIGR
jgi:hypothetical protein